MTRLLLFVVLSITSCDYFKDDPPKLFMYELYIDKDVLNIGMNGFNKITDSDTIMAANDLDAYRRAAIAVAAELQTFEMLEHERTGKGKVYSFLVLDRFSKSLKRSVSENKIDSINNLLPHSETLKEILK